jgi:hypothetical protein
MLVPELTTPRLSTADPSTGKVSITAAYQKEKRMFESRAVVLKGKDHEVATVKRGDTLTSGSSGQAITGQAADAARP